MFICAQLNEEKICHTVCILAEKIEGENIIELENYDDDLLGRKYENGQWSKEKFLE